MFYCEISESQILLNVQVENEIQKLFCFTRGPYIVYAQEGLNRIFKYI